LIYEAELAPWEAALGAEIPFHVDWSGEHQDSRRNAKRPETSRARTRPAAIGDLIVVTKIVVPSKISDAEKKLWEQLKRESHFHPRDCARFNWFMPRHRTTVVMSKTSLCADDETLETASLAHGELNLKVESVGKLLVHYKLAKPTP